MLLARLSEKRRSTFILFEIEGYSGEEIAALENVPVATVWTRLHHARRELAERLRELEAKRKA
jgi:RNA polymerase sigma-70 factor (ECF subfamily)